MKNVTLIFLFFLAFIGIPVSGRASHLVGGEIEYANVGPNTYRATCRLYYDCRVTIPPTTIQFNLRAPGCNAGVSFPSENLSVAAQVLNPYCTAVGNSCSSNALLNLRMASYTAIFTFTPQQLQCKDWMLSVKDCYRSGFVNIQNATNTCLYLEAYINSNINSNESYAPAFLPPSGMFVTVNQPATISNLVREQPNSAPDSLVYTLKRALEDPNTPIAYAANYSYLNPISSTTGVTLHPNTGMLTFRPSHYVNSANPEDNAYVVIVEATAFKKINGTMTRISSAQRSLPVYVVNNAPNINPVIEHVKANGVTLKANEVIQVWAGSPFTMTFETADANPGDSLTAFMPDQMIPGLNFTTKRGPRPDGTITWQTPKVTANKLVYFAVSVKDNACPVNGVNTQVFGVKLIANTLGLHEQPESNGGLTAIPNPFTNEVRFRINPASKARMLVICNLLGQEVEVLPLNQTGLNEDIRWENAGKYAAGVYVARLISEDKTIQTLKFTRQ